MSDSKSMMQQSKKSVLFEKSENESKEQYKDMSQMNVSIESIQNNSFNDTVALKSSALKMLKNTESKEELEENKYNGIDSFHVDLEKELKKFNSHDRNEIQKFNKAFESCKSKIEKNLTYSMYDKAVEMYRLLKPYYLSLHDHSVSNKNEFEKLYIKYFNDLENIISRGRTEESFKDKKEEELRYMDKYGTVRKEQNEQNEQIEENQEREQVSVIAHTQNDGTVSETQWQNIVQVDNWLVRNSVRRDRNNVFIVSNILALSARERMYIYYLIEKKCRKSPNDIDLVKSQSSYVPDLEAFKNQMTASKFKVWLRVKGMSHIYWDKLTDALQQLEKNKATIKSIKTDPIGNAQNTIESEINKLISTMSKYKGFFDEYEKLDENQKKSKENEKENKLNDIREEWDKVFNKKIPVEGVNLKSKQTDYTGKFKSASPYIGYANNAVSGGISVGEYIFGKMSGSVKEISDIGLLGIDSLEQFTSFINAIIDLKDYNKNFKDSTTEEKASFWFGKISYLFSATKFAEKVSKKFFEESTVGKFFTENATPMGIVTSGVKLCNSIYKLSLAGYHKVKFNTAKSKLKLSKNEPEDNWDKVRDKNKEEKEKWIKQRYESGMSKMTERMLNKKTILAGMDVAASVNSLAGSIVADPMLKTISKGIGVSFTAASTGVSYLLDYRNRHKSSGDFLGIDKLIKQIEEKNKNAKINRKEIKRQFMAYLGYASEESFFSYVTGKYAIMIYNNAFFAGDHKVYKVGNELGTYKNTNSNMAQKEFVKLEKEEKNQIEGYGMILNSLGLKTTYPETEGQNSRPSVETIKKKLNG